MFFGSTVVIRPRSHCRVVTWYMGSESKPKICLGSGLRGKGSGLRRMGSGITTLLSPNQGSDLLHGLKISYHNIFPHNKVCVHRISWPRYITYSCFRLAAVPVIRSPGCLTKTWYHILNLLIVEGTLIWILSHFSRFVTQLLKALSMPEGRERDLTNFFWREMGKKKKDKKKSCDRERYVSTSLTDLLLARVQA